MEGDGFSIIYSFLTCISIHSLRMEGDDLFLHSISTRQTFQSTPSAWRETCQVLHIFQHGIYFNPLPPHGGRLSYCAMCTISTYFNPLPPHGGRLHTGVNFVDCFLFQSTPSAWRETCYFLYLLYHAEHFNPLPPHGGRQWRKCTSVYGCGISIHSLRMEGDLERRQKRTGVRYFNPLPPHGGRQVICVSVIIVFLFQSTPSAWRETL